MKGHWKGTEECYPLLGPERMTGIVVVGFERSELFLDAPQFTPAMRENTLGMWFGFSNKIDQKSVPVAIENGAYLVTFNGRRSACSKPNGQLNGYGHMREYRDLALVDELISWKQVARLPDPFERHR